MPQVPQTFDALAVRAWCGLALDALGRAREEIDAINVYPVADGDTGTNLYLTLESAATAVEAVFAGHEAGGAHPGPTLADAVRAMAHGALIGARGNSGTILAQLLRGMAQVLAGDDAPRTPTGAASGSPCGTRPTPPGRRWRTPSRARSSPSPRPPPTRPAAWTATAAPWPAPPMRVPARRSPRPRTGWRSCAVRAWSTRAGAAW